MEYKDRRTELLFPSSGQTLNDVGGQNIAADAQTQSSRNKICSLHIDGNNKGIPTKMLGYSVLKLDHKDFLCREC